ncbi:MAG: hypothetical protein AAFQ41_04960 [Cyanobacteria bacterium J06623_7]
MPPARSGKFIKLLTAISPFVALAGIVVLQAQEYKKSVRQLNSADYLAREQERARSIDWQQQSPNLGFANLKANAAYLDFVQYFGNAHARETIGYELVPEYFEAINSIDPRFTRAHLTLSVANSMYAGKPDQTIALMERALASVEPESSDAAFLWTYKGLDELLFMGDKQAALDSYAMAAKWKSLTDPEYGTVTIEDLATALENASEVELKQAQIKAWSNVLAYIRDNQRQGEILAKIDALKADIAALEADAVP